MAISTTDLATLAQLMHDAARLAAPYDAQIHALEVAKADAIADVLFQIETLKALLRPSLLAAGKTVRCDGLTASVVHKDVWDQEQLRAMAIEMPALLQCVRNGSYVTFRLR